MKKKSIALIILILTAAILGSNNKLYSQDQKITVPGSKVESESEDILHPVEITRFTPNFGFEGSKIKIEGHNFKKDKYKNLVFFGDKPAEVDSVYHKDGKDVLIVHVPANPGNCFIMIKEGGKEVYSEDKFYFYHNSLQTSGIIFLTLAFGFVIVITYYSVSKVLRSNSKNKH